MTRGSRRVWFGVRTPWTVLVGLVLCLLALGCEPDPRNDAHLFLDRVQHIDLDDPLEERRRRVESLATLPVSSEVVQSARDACVEAHRAIIEAEQASARARAVLDRYPDEADIPVNERQDIEQDLRTSNRAMERSRDLFSRCHRMTRDLRVRYQRRSR